MSASAHFQQQGAAKIIRLLFSMCSLPSSSPGDWPWMGSMGSWKQTGAKFTCISSNAADVAAHGPAYLPLSSRAGGAETRASWRGWRVFNSTLGFAVGRLDRLDKGAVAPAKHLRLISPLQFGSLGSSRTASKRSRRPRPGSDCSPRALRRGS
jgi:hypothetical protein